ncbi:CDP-4-dehydro-6-deoxyglucose reductase [Lewinella aquimaris]|uniref:CDP-4-dehydro-6-deoxyglucose reductase n=1 Tax=Neolewinella aquimaris TaxID=1835722 RepID=A0A840E2Y7_9BACT|nr:FAD-binding oxidoreductase [Neolewinella aquimaris]MBB4079944.1 CDP-4-dehydro-6-deoxyglucose reductase [Neolewinella aquimaris]
MSKWKEAVVKRIEQRSPTVRSFWLSLPDRERLEFRPGQFLTLDLPISERRRERWRSYSIASAPDDTNEAELCIVQLPGGKGTHYLFEEAAVGTELLTKEPGGVFTLPERPLDYDVVMVCTGTGVAPFRSMLLQRLGHETRHFHLIYGCRTPEDLLYRDELERLAEEFSNFTYTATLSREMPANETPFEVLPGYVHQVYERDYAEVRSDVRFYLCGWSQMVDEARERLLKMGYAEEQVILELYG